MSGGERGGRNRCGQKDGHKDERIEEERTAAGILLW